jgi:hypothetical protein
MPECQTDKSEATDMNREEKMIALYLAIEKAYEEIVSNRRIRQCGEAPKISDVELLTVEIFSEMQGIHNNAAIWRYVYQHWLAWFPQLPQKASFAKQSQHLWMIKMQLFERLFPPTDRIHIIDGVPLPVCHYARRYRCKVYQEEATEHFCAAKNESYFGCKGHVIIDLYQRITGFTLTTANVDERTVIPNYIGILKGLLIGDKGYISQKLRLNLQPHDIHLETPLRDNMTDHRPAHLITTLIKTRRTVETVIGQLVESFNITRTKVRSTASLANRIVRKILAYNFNLTFKLQSTT